MQLKISTGLSASLLAGGLAALVSGCDTPGPSNPFTSAAPVVTNIYAVDSVNGVLPDVLVWSIDPTPSADGSGPNCPTATGTQLKPAGTPCTGGTGKTSKAPASYGSYRVEFSEPLDGAKIAVNNDLTASSFCSPVGAAAVGDSSKSPLQLVDVAGSGTVPPNQVLGTSNCYDPTSGLGQNPHLTVAVGDGVAFDPKAQPFTCQDFAPSGGNASGDVLRPNAQYSFNLKGAGAVGSASNLALAGATTFAFTTAGFELMAAGTQSVNNGYFAWLDKPYKGFQKDLAPVTQAIFNGGPCNSTQTTPCVPAQLQPFLLVFTSAIDPASAAAVTVTRTTDDPSCTTANPATSCFQSTGTVAAGILSLAPNDTWEPGVSYKITIPATVASVGVGAAAGTPLGTAKTYTFTADSPALSILGATPAAGATGVSVGFGSVTVEFQAPVDPATVIAANFTVKAADGTVVAAAPPSPFVVDGTNGQQVEFDLASPAGANNALTPSTSYAVAATNVKAAPFLPANLAGKPFPPFASTFTTNSFAMTHLYLPGSKKAASIDRSVTVSATHLIDGTLQAAFTDAPSTVPADSVSNTSLQLLELNNLGAATAIPGTTVMPFTPTKLDKITNSYTIAITDTNFKLKFGTGYQVKAAVTIKDSPAPAGSGQALKAEGCTTGDCSDVRTFTTNKFTATLARCDDLAPKSCPTPSDPTLTEFRVRFSYPVQASSVNPTLPTLVTLVKAGGTKVVVNCPALLDDKQTRIFCTSATKLDSNASYTATAVFTSGPGAALVTPTFKGTAGTFNADQTTGSFFGSLSTTFMTSCP